jgi:hypothetical protein
VTRQSDCVSDDPFGLKLPDEAKVVSCIVPADCDCVVASGVRCHAFECRAACNFASPSPLTAWRDCCAYNCPCPFGNSTAGCRDNCIKANIPVCLESAVQPPRLGGLCNSAACFANTTLCASFVPPAITCMQGDSLVGRSRWRIDLLRANATLGTFATGCDTLGFGGPNVTFSTGQGCALVWRPDVGAGVDCATVDGALSPGESLNVTFSPPTTYALRLVFGGFIEGVSTGKVKVAFGTTTFSEYNITAAILDIDSGGILGLEISTASTFVLTEIGSGTKPLPPTTTTSTTATTATATTTTTATEEPTTMQVEKSLATPSGTRKFELCPSELQRCNSAGNVCLSEATTRGDTCRCYGTWESCLSKLTLGVCPEADLGVSVRGLCKAAGCPDSQCVLRSGTSRPVVATLSLALTLFAMSCLL